MNNTVKNSQQESMQYQVNNFQAVILNLDSMILFYRLYIYAIFHIQLYIVSLES